MFTYNRPSLSLNGAWKFNPDPMQRCRLQQWWQSVPQGNNFFPCWDVEGLWDIQVPGTWKTQFTELKWYDGHATYLRDFRVEKVPDDGEAFLVFDGVVYSAQVYLNGRFVGAHDWGYSPFHFRVTDLLQENNRLFVLVENLLQNDRVPGFRFDWNNDGGIIGGVKLVFVPRVYIENFRTQTTLVDGRAQIDVEILLAGRDAGAREEVEFAIAELGIGGKVTAAVGSKTSLRLSVPLAKIELWSPGNPRLYRTTVATRHETIADDIGYREIKTRGAEIVLNGKPIRLYGLCVHAEFKDTGRAATPEGIRMLVAKARELGVNFLRCAHYPYAELFGRAMDRAGIMWWEEVPVYWVPQIDAVPAMKRQALGMLRETIVRDWNRASLIVWSTSNECAHGMRDGRPTPGRDEYRYWFEAAELIRSLDPSRLISGAECHAHSTANDAFKGGDEFAAQTENRPWRPAHPDRFYERYDILAANLYVYEPGEWSIVFHKLVAMLRRYHKPIVISEFGSMSLRGASSDPPKVGTEEHHCRMLRAAYRSFRELPEIKGWCPWCLADIRVPLHWRWYNQGKGVFRYGLLDENWEKKKAFAVVREETAALRNLFGGDI